MSVLQVSPRRHRGHRDRDRRRRRHDRVLRRTVEARSRVLAATRSVGVDDRAGVESVEVSSLAPCAACSRLVRGDVCPFCGAACAPRSTSRGLRRAARAALVAGTVGVGAAGCFFGAYGGPPPHEPTNQPDPSASVEPAASVDAGAKE